MQIPLISRMCQIGNSEEVERLLEEEAEDDIEVSEAEEDPLDGLLNAVATFQGCLEDDGFEFIGAPGQPGPDGETVDPSEFTPEYLGALQKCATESNLTSSVCLTSLM